MSFSTRAHGDFGQEASRLQTQSLGVGWLLAAEKRDGAAWRGWTLRLRTCLDIDIFSSSSLMNKASTSDGFLQR